METERFSKQEGGKRISLGGRTEMPEHLVSGKQMKFRVMRSSVRQRQEWGQPQAGSTKEHRFDPFSKQQGALERRQPRRFSGESGTGWRRGHWSFRWQSDEFRNAVYPMKLLR